MSQYFTGHARSPEQAAKMERLGDQCLFCDADDDDWPVLHRTEHWTIAPNGYPYAGTRHHLLLVPVEHVTDLVDLDAATHADFWTALAWARDELGLTHYSLGARCGDCALTGGTIAHVHVHLVVGDVDAPGHEPVRFKMSSPAPPDPPGVDRHDGGESTGPASWS